MTRDTLMRFPVNRLYKALVRQMFEEKQARERVELLLTQQSLRQAFAPAATPRRFEWSAL